MPLHNGGYSQTSWVVVTLLVAFPLRKTSNHENVSHTHWRGAQKGATCLRLERQMYTPGQSLARSYNHLTQPKFVQFKFVNSCEFIPGRGNSLMSCKMHVKQFQGSTMINMRRRQIEAVRRNLNNQSQQRRTLQRENQSAVFALALVRSCEARQPVADVIVLSAHMFWPGYNGGLASLMCECLAISLQNSNADFASQTMHPRFYFLLR